MRRLISFLILTAVSLCAADKAPKAEKGWTQLFNGKDMTGWKCTSENPETFSIKEGALVANGKRAHCFYVGDFMKHEFRNFEVKVDVMTLPNSNGGIYIMTEYQDTGWPSKGFEIQVNNSFKGDPRRTGSLYGVDDNMDQVAKDNEWFTEHIIAKGDTITIKVNDKLVKTWKQPADWKGIKDSPDRKIQTGTIALQGHDPGSTVYYKNIRIKPLK